VNDFSEARDVIAIGAAIALILGFSPVSAVAHCDRCALACDRWFSGQAPKGSIDCRDFVLGVRFLFAFALGRDWRMLAGALVCAAGIYFSVKLDPTLLDEAD
jgi:hypothetical protein